MFVVKGPKLARRGALVEAQGVYVRAGGMEYLYSNSTDASLAVAPGYNAYVPRIPLLTNDASDSARELFMQCSENPGNLYTGCPVVVKGEATECEESNALGGSRDLPCLNVVEAFAQQQLVLPPPPEPQHAAPPQPPPPPPAQITTGYISIDGVWKKYMRVNGVLKQPSGPEASEYVSEAEINRAWREAIHRCKVHALINIIGTVLQMGANERACRSSANVKYGMLEGRNPNLGPPPPSSSPAPGRK
jgi:hypothetical protein